MKTLVAATLVALALLSSTFAVQAASNDYPDWARAAFENTY
jgi:hypothetical protein